MEIININKLIEHLNSLSELQNLKSLTLIYSGRQRISLLRKISSCRNLEDLQIEFSLTVEHDEMDAEQLSFNKLKNLKWHDYEEFPNILKVFTQARMPVLQKVDLRIEFKGSFEQDFLALFKSKKKL